METGYLCVVCERMRTELRDKPQLKAKAVDGLSRFQLSCWRFHWLFGGKRGGLDNGAVTTQVI